MHVSGGWLRSERLRFVERDDSEIILSTRQTGFEIMIICYLRSGEVVGDCAVDSCGRELVATAIIEEMNKCFSSQFKYKGGIGLKSGVS